MENKILPIALGATISILLIATVLVPVCFIDDEESNVLEVWMITGQSNAVTGYSNNVAEVNAEVPAPSKNVYYYGGESLPARYQFYPSNPDTIWSYWDVYKLYNNGSWVFGGMSPALGVALTNATHHDVLILEASLAGSSIAVINNEGWTYTQKLIDHALDQIPSGYDKIINGGVVLVQGESDGSTGAITYTNSLNTFRSHYLSIGFDSFYVVQTSELIAPTVAETQVKWCEDTPGAYLATKLASTFTVADGTLNEDETHYTQKGATVIGYAVGSSIAEHYHVEHTQNNTLLLIVPLFAILAVLVYVVRSAVSKN